MFNAQSEWEARDEEFHSAAMTRYEENKAALMEGAPVPGEDGYEDFADAAGLPSLAELEATNKF
jgi:hypothetical protein